MNLAHCLKNICLQTHEGDLETIKRIVDIRKRLSYIMFLPKHRLRVIFSMNLKIQVHLLSLVTSHETFSVN
jgi:hypothetical protein